jgi:hypothetical protein
LKKFPKGKEYIIKFKRESISNFDKEEKKLVLDLWNDKNLKIGEWYLSRLKNPEKWKE